MRFKLETVDDSYEADLIGKYEKLGFTFVIWEWRGVIREGWFSLVNDDVYIEINTIEELMQLSKDLGKRLIINSYDNSITIYDGYIE